MSSFQTDIDQMPTIKVVLLEDHNFYRKGLAGELEFVAGIDLVGDTGDPDELFALIEKHQPNVVIIDLRIKGDERVGINVIQRLTSNFPEAKCLVLTAFSRLPNFLAAFIAGAKGFLRKEAEPEQYPSLDTVIRIIANGGRYYDPLVIEEFVRNISLDSLVDLSGADTETVAELTNRELEVLQLVAAGMQYKEIADRLSITERTVKAHMSNIRNKLKVHSTEQAIIMATYHRILNKS